MKYKLKHFVNCKTKNVVYGLLCTSPLTYVGQTQQHLKKRVQKQLSTISLAARDRAQGKKRLPSSFLTDMEVGLRV